MIDSDDVVRPAVPDVSEGKRRADGHLGHLFRQACAAHRLRMERALAPVGITLPQFTVLTMVDACPGACGADLARLTLLTPQTVCVIVGNLERDGLLTRTGDPGHGRIRRLELTDEGRARLTRCRPEVHAVDAAMLGDLSPDEQTLLSQWLVRMAQPDPERLLDPSAP